MSCKYTLRGTLGLRKDTLKGVRASVGRWGSAHQMVGKVAGAGPELQRPPPTCRWSGQQPVAAAQGVRHRLQEPGRARGGWRRGGGMQGLRAP